jgi:hypothetical protein
VHYDEHVTFVCSYYNGLSLSYFRLMSFIMFLSEISWVFFIVFLSSFCVLFFNKFCMLATAWCVMYVDSLSGSWLMGIYVSIARVCIYCLDLWCRLYFKYLI